MASSTEANTATNGRGQPHRKRTLSDRRYKKNKDPAFSAMMKARWQDPEFREKQRKFREYAKQHPEKYTRKGVPDGWTKREATIMWEYAREKAKALVAEFTKEDGTKVSVPVPGSDEAKGQAALEEACVLALGPTDNRTKLMALRTVLEFTKQKPTTKIDQALSGPEDFLKAAIAASKGKPQDDTNGA